MAELTSKVIFISTKKTSMRLANAEWEAIDTICKRENIKRNNLLEMININKDKKMGLTCAVRLFCVSYFYSLLTDTPRPNYSGTISTQATPIFKAIKGIL
ncbi:MAG: ribbon-helix-helix domain-containing protein [Alphaproteobacteria bacterium]|nr:ribbon-helix-helix domain-containing protein [Alphaproteobacteria bacterium]